ncbi:HAD-IC family P-type ATPase [Methylobacterium sp. SD274]|uniref:cation-translocating P-type ATPase n=1 Tax=unclassified Methylobacterium TaxID=2615210 RepID=UPI001A969572|nr:HAD-IC family P-type ATPase [Methylobacterium sp. SD274]MBO1021892.1 HAD-IC family P-type ATPase [Methylobacterium sp. SD274]
MTAQAIPSAIGTGLPSTPVPFPSRSAAETARDLHTDILDGLSGADVAERLARDGPNTLAKAASASALKILLHQFQSLMVVLLIAACGVALALGERIEAGAILVVILLNAAIGFVTEWKAAAALDGLRKQAVSLARVVRDGRDHQVETADLVAGDVVLLSEGDRVHADGRVVEQARLQVDEAALTGESLPVAKSADPVLDAGAALGDRTSMVHRSTAVTAGRGRFIVTATGPRTEIGRIGALIAGVAAHGTPLEAKLAQLSRALLVIVLALCLVIILVGWLRGNALLYMVEVGISLAVAAVPEGLLAVTTMTLAIGMQRMARMNALVRRLPAVESLGSTTVICTDKTGTLTRNEMTVRAYDVAARRYEVTGAGYAAAGGFSLNGEAFEIGHDEPLELALRIGALCNDARVDRSGETATALGDPTEAALIVAAEKAGLELADLARAYPRIAEIPFDSDTKLMVTVHATPEGTHVAYVKGAPAEVLKASVSVLGADGTASSSPTERTHIENTNEALAASALRVLGLAHRVLPQGFVEADLTRDLTFVGLVGMGDPLREGVRATIATCRAAGIRTVMITGDQEATAAEIARQLDLDVAPDGTALKTVHARDLAGLDDAGWLAVVADAAVFARVSPEHKLRIVDALQRRGNVVAMTGDGVNDAPALRKADIGIAMGIRGTEVAKDAADMVITDDDFSTIVSAVEQGRVIVSNILRFIHYLFSCNLAEIVTVFAAVMIGWPMPLGVMQILWLNLVTDIFPAMALALEPSDPDVMARPPRDPEEPLMTPAFGWLIVWQGLLLGGCTLAAFAVGMEWYGVGEEGLRHAVTIAFMTLAMTQVVHAFSARSRRRSAFTANLFTNAWLWGATAACVGLQLAAVYVPLLRQVLHTVPLTMADWGVVGLGALTPFVVIELVKFGQAWVRPAG